MPKSLWLEDVRHTERSRHLPRNRDPYLHRALDEQTVDELVQERGARLTQSTGAAGGGRGRVIAGSSAPWGSRRSHRGQGAYRDTCITTNTDKTDTGAGSLLAVPLPGSQRSHRGQAEYRNEQTKTQRQTRARVATDKRQPRNYLSGDSFGYYATENKMDF